MKVVTPRNQFGVYIHANYGLSSRENTSIYDDSANCELNKSGQRYVASPVTGEINLPHNTMYGVCVWNSSLGGCNVCVYIDNQCIGDFLVASKSVITLKRSVNSNRSLIFVSASSNIAKTVKLSSGDDLGVIKVLLFPEDMSHGEYLASLVEKICISKGGKKIIVKQTAVYIQDVLEYAS